MIAAILISLGSIIAIVLVIVAMQPPTFRITRSTAIAAPSSIVFQKVNNLQEWNAWSPWAQLDPSMKQTYDGPPQGIDAICSWNELVRLKLEFFKPFKATNTAEFSLTDQANQTLVTWSMTGQKNFPAKAFHLIMNMDKMLGSDFEKGLSKLKSISESPKGH
jgi:hypothetical protein